MGILALLSIGAATAQKPSPKGPTLPPPPSAANQEGSKTGKKPAQSKPHSDTLTPASQEDLAESIVGDAFNQLIHQADLHFHKGEYDHSINLYRIVVQGDPRNTDAYANMSWALWSTDRREESIAVLKQGIQTNPDTYIMYDHLGTHLYLFLKDPAAAIPYLEKATTIKNPKPGCTFSTWNSLAHCYEKTNQWEKAVHAWEKAVLYVDNPSAPNNLKRAQKKLAELQGNKGQE